MPGGYLYGWDGGNEIWRKMVCDSNGKLIIDPTAILEDSPTDGELKKGPTSNWAFNHDANAAAHHAKYTDENSRAAINDRFNYQGRLINSINCQGNKFQSVGALEFINLAVNLNTADVFFDSATNSLRITRDIYGNGFGVINLMLFDGSDYEKVAVEPVVDTKIETHKDIANAHHDKYTDANAQAACNLGGDLFWSCPGNAFFATQPNIQNVTKYGVGYVQANADNISLSVGVSLPQGSTVTKVIVYGNTAAEAENWYLRRIKLTDRSWSNLGNASINTEDTTIGNEVIDNILYGYFLTTTDIDTNDEIWGARITFTL